jgi:hypothetical protein
MDKKTVSHPRARVQADQAPNAREQPSSLPPENYLLDWSKLVTTGPGRVRCLSCGCRMTLHPTRDSIDRLLTHWRLHAPEEADRFLNFLRRQSIAILEDLADLLLAQGPRELFRRYSNWSATAAWCSHVRPRRGLNGYLWSWANPRAFLDANQVSLLFGCSPWTLRNWEVQGKLRAIRLAGLVRFEKSAIEEFIAACRV